MFPTPIVSAPWLLDHLNDPELIILDASAYMPAEGKSGAAEFAKGHLPGAQFFDIDFIADQETDLPHMVPSQGRFGRLVRALGIHRRSKIVCYDQKGLFSAARAWWLLRLFGHERVAVLDGGLPQWQAAGGATEAGEAPAPAPGDFLPNLKTALWWGLGDVLDNLTQPRAHLVDARARPRFEGSGPEPRPGLPSGHIPGSGNLPFTDLLNPDQTLKDPATLQQLFANAGVDGRLPVVCTCGSGLTATVLALGLAVAGHEPAAVYDGSWTEWASRPETPKAEGPACFHTQ